MSGKRKETTAAEREIIIRLHKQNKSYSEIGKIVNRSRFSIRSIIKQFQNSEHFESRKRTGRPRKLTEREEIQIVRKI